MNIGDIRLGDTIDLKFTTVNTTGAPTTLAGSPSVAAYPGNSTTEITAGITLSVDFDSRTGMHNVRVVASSGNGYATATEYALVVTAGTVGGQSIVGYVIGMFSIEKRSALMPVTAGRQLIVDAAGLADANMVKAGPTGSGTAQTARDLGASVLLSPGTGTGQVSLSSGAVTVGTNNDKTGYGLSAAAVQAIWDALTSALSTVNSIGKLLVDNINATISSRLASASYTAPPSAASIADAVAEELVSDHSGTAGSVAAALANLDEPISGVITDVALVQLDTNDIQDRLPAALTASGNIKADAQVVSDKTGYGLSAAGVQAIWDALTSALSTANSIGKAIVDAITAITGVKATTDKVETVLENSGGGNSRFSAAALTQIDKTGYRLSATGVDDILDEAITEPSGVFSWSSASLRTIVGWLGAIGSNKVTETASAQVLRNRADSGTIGTSSVADDGTTASRGSFS